MPSETYEKMKGSCELPAPQAILGGGFNVVLVNRPGFGKSIGPDKLGGARDRAALESFFENHPKIGKSTVGGWAYGKGTVSLAIFARSFPLEWLILGNGIYDAELASIESPDSDLKERLVKLQNQDEEAFDQRSIAWDYEGLPKKVYLYHPDSGFLVPAKQVQSFRDSLKIAEYSVELKIIPTSKGFSQGQHYQVVRRFVGNISKKSGG